jgi:cation diffusion facilitator CzcD-associated flavoprotein CzcO
MPEAVRSSGEKRVCVIGAGPCGLTALRNLLRAGHRNVVCYEEHSSIGGNWAFTDDPRRASVHASARSISPRRMASFDNFRCRRIRIFPRTVSCSPISPTTQGLSA